MRPRLRLPSHVAISPVFLPGEIIHEAYLTPTCSACQYLDVTTQPQDSGMIAVGNDKDTRCLPRSAWSSTCSGLEG